MHGGAPGDVAGGTYFFEHSGADGEPTLHPGQLVPVRTLDALRPGQVELLGALTGAQEGPGGSGYGPSCSSTSGPPQDGQTPSLMIPASA